MLLINADEKNAKWLNPVFGFQLSFIGDASAIMTENENMVYSVPKEGTNLGLII